MGDAMRDLLSKLDAIEQRSEPVLPEVGDAFGISLSEDFEISTEIVGFTADGIVVELDDEAQAMLESQGVRFYEGYLEEEKDKGTHGKACWKGYRRVGQNDCEKIKESGLQYYTGVKKHGEEYMKRAAEAGRKGASQEELGRLKDRYSKAEKNKPQKEDGDSDSYSLYIDDYDLDERYSDLDDAIEAVEAYKRDDPKSAFADYNIRDNNGKIVWNNDAWQEGMDEAKYQGREVPLGKKMAGDVKKSKVYVRKPNGNIVKVNFGDKKMRIKKSNPARRKSFRARHNCKNPGPRWKARYWSCRSW